MPKIHPHPRAATYAHLFDELASFSELEARISALADSTLIGEAFEVFVWAYLVTQPIRQAAEVWAPTSEMTDAECEGVLSRADKGVDGAFRDYRGVLRGYQVKFRTGRGTLAWKDDGLGTFTSHRMPLVLITNAESHTIPAHITGPDFYAIHGRDFDDLGTQDFDAIATLIASEVVQRDPLTPRPHQQTAIRQITDEFDFAYRAQAVMACGTGKTLTALWVAEALVPAGHVLVLLPSLALLRQTLHAWLGNTSWARPSFICVCSDESVQTDADDLVTSVHAMDFAVANAVAPIKEFLSSNDAGVGVVFSTYQSSHLVGRAVTELNSAGHDFWFDFAFFDEAHKTAGASNRSFSIALSDEGIPVRRRLFMTATPRHYALKSGQDDQAADCVYSMDDEDVYGRCAYKLPFSQAVSLGLIVPYKVIVSVIQEPAEGFRLTREQLNTVAVEVSHEDVTDNVNARLVATQLAIQQAVAAYGVERVISFHGRKRDAQYFASKGLTGIGCQLPGFEILHVHGEMPMATRAQVMRKFADAPRALITNARCLTEGVDVPSVDMVAFIAPRRSLVDITQATGRAMRLHTYADGRAKETGYVFLPVFVEPGETIEQAVDRGAFSQVWDTLNALRDQDDILAETVKSLAIATGKSVTWSEADTRVLDDRVECMVFPSRDIDLAVLKVCIRAEAVAALSDNWHEMFGLLLRAASEEFGTVNVSTPAVFKGKAIGQWVQTQRKLCRKGFLSTDRQRMLTDAGLVWQVRTTLWNDTFAVLARYARDTGSCNVKFNQKVDGVALGYWVDTQRCLRRENRLAKDRVARLDSIGFVWGVTASWEDSFALLERHVVETGHCRVTGSYKVGDFALGQWVAAQRSLRRAGLLAADKIARLDSIGFAWDVAAGQSWEASFALLEQYFHETGTGAVRQDYKVGDFALGQWAHKQRYLRKAGRLTESRIARLDAIGFVWEVVVGQSWEASFTLLAQHFLDTGTSHVQINHKVGDFALGLWAVNQRALRNAERLACDRIALLDSIGFAWDVKELAWEECFALLELNVLATGTCEVSQHHKVGDFALGRWVQKQRSIRRAGHLAADRIARLDSIGFVWDTRDGTWDAGFALLERHFIATGTCNVKRHHKVGDFALGVWVGNQRASRKAGLLAENRIARLDSIGFVWDTRDGTWDAGFALLERHFLETGTCNVKQHHKDGDFALGMWVTKQRSFRKAGSLPEDRFARLDSIGFVWDVDARQWEDSFTVLEQYVRETGNCFVKNNCMVGEFALGTWVKTQRRSCKAGMLAEDQIARLDLIGFVWDVRAELCQAAQKSPSVAGALSCCNQGNASP